MSAEVGGEPLWFESPDLGLCPAPEAFGCALLVAAIHDGRRLVFEEEVSAKWLANAVLLLDSFYAWWRYPKLAPRAAPRADDGGGEGGQTALCFSGGVDSFYSLLRGGRQVDLLAGVHGYDIDLPDFVRASAFETSLRAVAAELGLRGVVVRTNLREHRASANASWERTHGGALAAVGHLLGGTVSRLLISSSQPYSKHKPWGTHWLTDPLWSSDRLEVVHVGEELSRYEKLKAIANEPLVRRHLRVCWENLAPKGNCSRCEKCLRTSLFLAEWGELENFPTFEGPHTLAGRLDELPAIRGRGSAFVRLLESRRLAPEVEVSVRKLLRRTKRSETLTSRFVKRMYAWVQKRLR